MAMVVCRLPQVAAVNSVLYVTIGQLGNTMAPSRVTVAKDSLGGVSVRVMSIFVASKRTVRWTRTRGTSVGIVGSGSVSKLE